MTTKPTDANARPTDVLSGEHRVIERVMVCLERMADVVRTGESLDRGDATDAARFLADFADTLHHGKEETYLFPAMERSGVPAHAGPTSVMRREHEIGRAHVRAMTSAACATPIDGATFAQHASEFVLLLRDHIGKEDEILFPMANGVIGPDAQMELREAFAAVDSHEGAATMREECMTIADRLWARYAGGAEIPLSTPSCGGGSRS